MKVYFISLLLIVLVWADEDVDQYYDDGDNDGGDIYTYYEPPILGPSKVSLDEIYDPNYQVNPESTITFNYNQMREGEMPQQVELRKESIKHYFRVRKPTTQRTIFHIRRNKFDENQNLEGLSKDAEILNELKDIEKRTGQEIFFQPTLSNVEVETTIPTPQAKRMFEIKRPSQIQEPSPVPFFEVIENTKNDGLELPLITESNYKASTIPAYVSSDRAPIYNAKRIQQLSGMHIRSRQQLRKLEDVLEKSTAVPTTVQIILEEVNLREQDHSKIPQQYTTSQPTTLMSTTNMEIRLSNEGNSYEQQSKFDNTDTDFNNSNNDNKIISSSTSQPILKEKSQPRRMRYRFRKLKRVKSALHEKTTENLPTIVPQNTEKYVTPKEEITHVTSNAFITEDQSEPQRTETPISQTSSTHNLKNTRKIRRKWLQPRSTTSKPETTSFSAMYSDLPDESDTKRPPRRMRYRKKFRKSHRTNRRQNFEAENTPATTTTTTTTVAPSTYENDYDDLPTDTENVYEEKPKGKFNKNNPPPPLPTLSPWYDGYGK